MMMKTRTDSIFILFLILTSVSMIGGQGKKNQDSSNLKQLYENLRILSRITNAIHLHFSAIQKEVKIDEVLTEVFRITPEEFYKIVMIDARMTEIEMSRMQEEFNKFDKKERMARRSNKGQRALAYTEISMAVRALDFFTELPRHVEMVKEVLKYPADQQLIEVQKLSKSGLFKSSCIGIDHENLNTFQSLFDEKPETYSLPSDNIDDTKAIFQKFVNQHAEIAGCLNRMKQLQKYLNELNLIRIHKDNQNLRDVRKLAEDLSMFYRIGTQLHNLIQRLHSSTVLTEAIWKPTKNSNVTSLLQNSISTFRTFYNNLDGMEMTHTAGFRNAQEFLRVFYDLKNPWFKKNIARGASVKNLTKALEPYRNVSQMIVTLDHTWKALYNYSRFHIPTRDIQTAAECLKNITEFAPKVNSGFKVLKSIEEKITTYLKESGVPNFDSKRFLDYDKEQRPAEIIVQKIQEIQQKVSDLLKTMVPEANADQVFMLLTVLKGFSNTTFEEFTPIQTIHTIKMFLRMNGERELKLFEKLKAVSEISKELEVLKNMAEGVKNGKTSSPMADIIKDLKIVEFANRFSKDVDELNEVKDFFNFFKDILTFPKDTHISTIKTYLSKIADVQKGITLIGDTVKRSRKLWKSSKTDIIRPMNNSKALNENFGNSLQILENFDDTLQKKDILLKGGNFSEITRKYIKQEGLTEWIEPEEAIRNILEETAELDKLAGKVKDKDVDAMAQVFDEAAKIKGIIGRQKQLNYVYADLYEDPLTKNSSEMFYFRAARNFDLDFARHHSRLSNARVTIHSLTDYFDEIFGHVKKDTVTIERQIPVSWTAIIFICIGFILLVFILVLALYGLTERGRTYYKNLYLFYFGKPEDFEKRWRYSLFMDTIDSKNALLDAAREGNKSNLVKALKNGAYVNAYNKFGNTALHVAMKDGNHDQVTLLIKHGADQTLLNYKNLLAIQMIPQGYEKLSPDKVAKYNKVKKIHKKYDKKSFRVSVPRHFPTSSFRVWADDSTDAKLTNQFLDAFRSIVSDEPSPQTTHVVFKTDKDGIVEIDNIDSLYWIFHGAIIMKEQWMTDCINDEALIRKDMDYLVEKVKYKGVVYDNVLTWSEAMAKATMPYLQGVFVTVVAKDCQNLQTINNIVTSQGGILMNTFPFKQLFNIGSRPYLHANLGPLFLIHDGTEDMSTYRNDPDKMYTLFTEEEFLHFMLKREIHQETRTNAPNILIRED